MLKGTFSDNCIECPMSKEYLKCLSEEELDFLNSNKTQIQYKKGEIIFKQGAYASFIVYINEGISKVYVEGASNKNILIRLVQARNFIGITDLFNSYYNYSAIALNDVVVCLIKKEAFHTLLRDNPKFAEMIIKAQCETTTFIYNKLAVIGTKQMHGRLAESIIYLIKEAVSGKDIFTYMTRKDIAELAGMSTESAIRLLTEFKNDGIITISGKEIEINNIDLLQKLCDVG